ncbi:hypothetical protein GCM10010218_42270 [Streptomyces mashuensis]|uniref:Uncharacterized protein n=1 Tax=Streptomyces mashuensis TaxID=33904 RepID=A0A919B5B2_9ACTN|nr:hypothetical protein GCM10010218_42270 [Streptomyces mashuensis]
MGAALTTSPGDPAGGASSAAAVPVAAAPNAAASAAATATAVLRRSMRLSQLAGARNPFRGFGRHAARPVPGDRK